MRVPELDQCPCSTNNRVTGGFFLCLAWIGSISIVWSNMMSLVGERLDGVGMRFL